MISTWSQFLDFFSVGCCCGFTVGLLCLAIRRIRITTYNSFKSAMHF